MTTPKRPDKRTDTFERKGGYPSARVPRSQMKPPPSSATRPKPQAPQSSTTTR
jgi:hypothetical protein